MMAGRLALVIPDLGRYALEVGLAYAGSLTLLAGLTGWVWWRGRRVRARLAAIEARRRAWETTEDAR